MKIGNYDMLFIWKEASKNILEKAAIELKEYLQDFTSKSRYRYLDKDIFSSNKAVD